MALIFDGKSKCALCGVIIASEDEIVATSHFVADPNDFFWKYSDAPFHRRCFLAWEKREEFIGRFNETMKLYVFGNGKRNYMLDDGTITQVES
jgi:hypothetical protein